LTRFRIGLLLVASMTLAVSASACAGSDGPAKLTLEWSREDATGAAVSPTESLKSILIVRNDGGADLDSVTLRFNQNETGDLPYGISVGTVTNVSSRFDGDAQVWDLGPIGAGDAVAFPMTLWFEASSRTAEPLAVHLRMVASSPALPSDVESNLFEVMVDTRQAAGR
jgi:hypothetical protein